MYNYQLNCGQYVLHDDEKPIGRVLDTVAICLDKESGTRHKFGDPEIVRQWCSASQKKFREAGFDDMADALVVIEGRFTLEDLNNVIDITDYAFRLYQKVIAGTALTLDLVGHVVRPTSLGA
jgi:hypothetical protein